MSPSSVFVPQQLIRVSCSEAGFDDDDDDDDEEESVDVDVDDDDFNKAVFPLSRTEHNQKLKSDDDFVFDDDERSRPYIARLCL